MTADLLSERARTARSSAVRDLLRLTEQPHVLSLAGGLPAPQMLPVEAIRRATLEVLDRLGPAALQYGPTEGISPLRAMVGARLGDPALSEGTVITTGSQQALDLVARVLLDPGDVVVAETPTYLGALSALHWQQPVIEGVIGDRDGMRTDVLADRLADGLRPKMVYVVTEFANPTGATMSLERRHHLAALAERYGFVIVEDDPYGALRFRGTRHPPIRTWSDRVVTLGSASKVLAPGLRVGWLTAPDWLARPVVIAKQAADLHTATLNQQLVLAMLGDDEWFSAHVAAIVAFYGIRAECLQRSLRVHLGDAIEFSAPDGGMFVWGQMTDPLLLTGPLLERAVEQGVAFVPGSAFRHDAVDDGTLRLCFTTLDAEQLDEAARRLARAVTGG